MQRLPQVNIEIIHKNINVNTCIYKGTTNFNQISVVENMNTEKKMTKGEESVAKNE